MRFIARIMLLLTALLASHLPVSGQDTPSQEGSLLETRQARSVAQFENAEGRLLKKFESATFQSMTDSANGCVDCHSSEGVSSLVLTGRPLEDVRRLLDDGYFAAEGPDTLLGRVTSSNPERRMPKDAEPWNPKQIRQLRQLVQLVEQQEILSGVASDEKFPRSLLSDFHDPAPRQLPNQFLSYRQLRAKIWSIFHDAWIRGDRDLFSESISAFGGADFEARFNESTAPNAAYLSALETMSRDVSLRAFRTRAGPFSDFDKTLDPDSRIQNLYQAILFRSASEAELRQARKLLNSVQAMDETISQRDSQLEFEVSVSDPQTGRQSTRVVSIPIRGERIQIQQTIIDQSQVGEEAEDTAQEITARIFQPLATQLAHAILGREQKDSIRRIPLGMVRLGPDTPGRVVVHNQGTHRNVSFAGIELWDAAGEQVKSISVDSTDVQLEGAWERQNINGLSYVEDENRHKGLSTIQIALSAEQAGPYTVLFLYRPDSANANNVLAELYGKSESDTLRPQMQPAVPPERQANFHYHCGDDTIPFFQVPGEFQFDDSGYIQISNSGTKLRVTAGAVELVNAENAENNFLIDSEIAQGAEDWEAFEPGSFRSYNVLGKLLHDDNLRKGELTLKYRLAGGEDYDWQAEQFYKVRVYYPGKRDHEPLVPVEVHALRSSPIVQVAHPSFARSTTRVTIDASTSYTIQRSELKFQWRQISGPTVIVDDWSTPSISFVAPSLQSDEIAWASLCGALIRHPDFLFTRPPSIDSSDPDQRLRLQLVRLALDLVSRPPTQEEFTLLNNGMPLNELVDRYLETEEFRDFYFHRVRLYLESQGTALQDEPARLWSYVAFNDRPFQEILTADYTVDEEFQRVSRPEFHGRTGVLTTKGFIDGKPGLPHYNYAAQVSMLFLGYVYEVPAEIVDQREGVTALGTTDPNSVCYSCHKILTPLSFQRLNWTDEGVYRTEDEAGLEIDPSDRGAVQEYPFKGSGLEAFATQAVEKERFIRTMINTHVNFYFGRPMEHLGNERVLYKRLWDNVNEHDFKIRDLIRAIVSSPEYAGNSSDARQSTVANILIDGNP